MRAIKSAHKADYLEAQKHLEAAMAIFNKISKADQKDWDADHFASQVDEILSCDNGECGLKPFIARIK